MIGSLFLLFFDLLFFKRKALLFTLSIVCPFLGISLYQFYLGYACRIIQHYGKIALRRAPSDCDINSILLGLHSQDKLSEVTGNDRISSKDLSKIEQYVLKLGKNAQKWPIFWVGWPFIILMFIPQFILFKQHNIYARLLSLLVIVFVGLFVRFSGRVFYRIIQQLEKFISGSKLSSGDGQ